MCHTSIINIMDEVSCIIKYKLVVGVFVIKNFVITYNIIEINLFVPFPTLHYWSQLCRRHLCIIHTYYVLELGSEKNNLCTPLSTIHQFRFKLYAPVLPLYDDEKLLSHRQLL